MGEVCRAQKQILVTEDDASILRLVVAILKRAGYAVDTATCGRIALEKIGQRRYDVVVLDLMMAGVDGFDVLTALAHDHSRKRFVVVMSAASPNVIAKATTRNVFAALQKPFELVELLTTVDTCIAAQAAGDHQDVSVPATLNTPPQDVRCGGDGTDRRGASPCHRND